MTGQRVPTTLAALMPPDALSMSRTEFEMRLRELLGAEDEAAPNTRCVACTECEGSTDCTFCSRSSRLSRCHYCVACTECTDSSHCASCQSCLACQHCVQCDRCIGSAYLVRSVGCSGCTYCFGCVNLAKKDFHILNVRYERAGYFATVARLARELGIELP